MFGWDEGRDSYQQAYESDNKAEFSHELLSGGAGFAAMKVFEDHQRKEGKPVSHQFAKELLAGFAAAEVDKLAETKGADFIDRERAKRDASRNAENLYDQHYGDYDQYDPNQQQPHGQLQDQFQNNNW